MSTTHKHEGEVVAAEHHTRWATADLRNDGMAAVPYIRQGQLISLVHWNCSRDGWSYLTVLAEYAGRDEDGWHVVVRGEAVTLPRSEWAIFT